eukprot:11798250-Alexandrium_andersonii.AAC.1
MHTPANCGDMEFPSCCAIELCNLRFCCCFIASLEIPGPSLQKHTHRAGGPPGVANAASIGKPCDSPSSIVDIHRPYGTAQWIPGLRMMAYRLPSRVHTPCTPGHWSTSPLQLGWRLRICRGTALPYG